MGMCGSDEEVKVGVPEHIELSNGSKMPIVGLGTWKATDDAEVIGAVKCALANGYRHIDAAACYGNEKIVGQAMTDGLKEAGLKREDIFVTGKLWNSEHDPAHVKAALEMTLADLQTDYLDLFLIHWPQCWEHEEGKNVAFPKTEEGGLKYTDTPLMDTWKALEKCVEAGLTKAIGLSNFNSEQIKLIMAEGTVKPAVLQVEIHPFFSNDKLVKFAQSQNIAVTAYSPLGSGVEIAGEKVIDNAKLKEVGAKYEKSAAQIVLAWLINRNIIVIPKSVKDKRVKENFDVRVKLSDEDMATIDAINKDARGGYGGPLVEGQPRDITHPHYPFRFEDKNPTLPEF